MKDKVIKSLFGEEVTINDRYLQATLKINVNVKKYMTICGVERKVYELNVNIKSIRRMCYGNPSFNLLTMYSRITKGDLIDIKSLIYEYLNGHIAPLINTTFYRNCPTRFRDGSEITINRIKCVRA
jgi:hypothetical protein